jgi:hypothetical protein
MEAIKNIIAELRNSGNDDTCPWWADGGSCDHCPLGKMGTNCPFRKFADRIEQAVTNCNQSKMHDALLKVKNLFDGRIMFQPSIRAAHKAVNAALSAPPRNCDVGTSEEQAKRFDDFCDSYMYAANYKSCGTCPLWTSGTIGEHCELKWSQLPYKSKESDESEVSDDKN